MNSNPATDRSRVFLLELMHVYLFSSFIASHIDIQPKPMISNGAFLSSLCFILSVSANLYRPIGKHQVWKLRYCSHYSATMKDFLNWSGPSPPWKLEFAVPLLYSNTFYLPCTTVFSRIDENVFHFFWVINHIICLYSFFVAC